MVYNLTATPKILGNIKFNGIEHEIIEIIVNNMTHKVYIKLKNIINGEISEMIYYKPEYYLDEI